MVSHEIIEEISVVQTYMQDHDVFAVIHHQRKPIGFIKENDFVSFFNLIKDADSDYFDCYIGIKYLGKPEALLCRYIEAKGVFIHKGTMKGIATLIVGNIPHQIEMLVKQGIETTENQNEQLRESIMHVDDPTKAYDILNQKILQMTIHSG
jgi:hypothetical protein